MCGDTDPERDHQGWRPKPTAHYRRFRRSSYAPRVGTDSDMHGCQSGSDSHITDCPGVTHTGFRRYPTSPLVFMRSVEMAQFSLFSPLVDKFHLKSLKRAQKALKWIFSLKYLVESWKSCTFAPTQPTYQPTGQECQHPEEDLAQSCTRDSLRPTSMGVFLFIPLPFPSLHAPDQIFQPRGGFAGWVRGAGAEPRSRHPNPKFPWYGFWSRAFLKKVCLSLSLSIVCLDLRARTHARNSQNALCVSTLRRISRKLRYIFRRFEVHFSEIKTIT